MESTSYLRVSSKALEHHIYIIKSFFFRIVLPSNEVSQTENLELQIEETPKLELDEASSDDEEEERERERLKQQAVNQL